MNDRILNQSSKKSSEGFAKVGYRQELINGETMPKAAANRWHNLIATNIAIAVGTRLSGNKSEIYVNGMRVLLKSDLICYPDVVIVNAAPAFTDQNVDVLRNPTIVFEIVSNATSPIDKAQKLKVISRYRASKNAF